MRTTGTTVADDFAAPDEALAEAAAFAAFEAELGRLHLELSRYLRSRLHDLAAAEDLAQDSCMRVLRYRPQLRGDALRSMLYRIANNLLADHWRRARTRNFELHEPIEADALPSGAPTPDEVLIGEQRRQALKKAILRLPAKCRQVFIMARIQGLPHSQIARECGITIATVDKHLARALVICADIIGGQDL